ncbi:ATP phosphoribosyltransferase [bacterium]|nr:MAG: ATP phosphoribosyltransferase [bacterium]
MSLLKLGIPKGSLEKSTIDLFGRAGWKIHQSSRNYFPSVDDKEVRLSLVRAQEMSRYVEAGVLDAGLTGKDWILENDSDVVEVCDLVYSKASTNPARWVLVVPGDSPFQRAEDLAGKKISTELVGFTKRFFSEKGVEVEVEFSWGATEAKVVEGLCDAIVEVTETGSTIKAHGLRIIDTLLVTNTKLIANKTAWSDPARRKKIQQISLLLQGALRAEGMVGLKMNVPLSTLDTVMELVPSLQAPTVAHLYKSDWLSVETVVLESVVRELVPKLMEMGATGIIEYPLNKVI